MGNTDKLIALAGVFAAIGGVAVIEFAPEAFEKMGLFAGIVLVLIGLLLFVWAFLRKERQPMSEKPKPRPGTGIFIAGDDGQAHGNIAVGFESGIHIEGDRNSTRDNTAIAPEKPPAHADED